MTAALADLAADIAAAAVGLWTLAYPRPFLMNATASSNSPAADLLRVDTLVVSSAYYVRWMQGRR